ncbi:hypothetical protein DVT68_11215 [Dyella solisilvae]|uniref:Acyloxyacyl hydrolase n=1 Tax=Dyella solisilvae TaxID=1920168 RepID=A0A370K8S2_9GAMM|nr:acyloxyacyl hydrolase [Dyella solisilvae]RDI99046.1 hypothetical protein DVT68_11215 [Dyella solisilvae]
MVFYPGTNAVCGFCPGEKSASIPFSDPATGRAKQHDHRTFGQFFPMFVADFALGWQGERWSLQVRHVSNAGLKDPNLGETMLLLGLAFNV